MKTYIKALIILGLLGLFSCSSENEAVVEPGSVENYPQLILFDDEGGGELEDSDEMSVDITLADRYDPSGEEPGGKIFPLSKDVTIEFKLADLKGFEKPGDYVLGCKAYYEIDDCTSSLDEDIDLLQSYNPATGIGLVTFPAGVETITLEFELDDEFFDDDEANDERGFSIVLGGAETASLKIYPAHFEYKVLDDEVIFGEYKMEVSESSLKALQDLFGLVNEDIAELSVDDIKKINVEFGYEEMGIKIVMKETEEVEECGEVEIENKEIELEMEYAELTDDDTKGELELEGAVELENGAEEEFVYKGSFKIEDDQLYLILTGEFDGDETEEITLQLKK